MRFIAAALFVALAFHVLPPSASATLHRAGPEEVPGVVPILVQFDTAVAVCSGTKLSDKVILTAQHCPLGSVATYVFPSDMPDPAGIYPAQWDDPHFFTSLGGIKASRQLFYNRDQYKADGAREFDHSTKRNNIRKWRNDVSIFILEEPLNDVPSVTLSATNDFKSPAMVSGYGYADLRRGRKYVGEVRRFRKKLGTYMYRKKDGDPTGPGFSGGFFGRIAPDGTAVQIGIIDGMLAPINFWNGNYMYGYHMAPITHDVICWIQNAASLDLRENCNP